MRRCHVETPLFALLCLTTSADSWMKELRKLPEGALSVTLGVSGPIKASSRVDDISSGAPGAACTPPATGTGRAAPVLPSCEPSIMNGSRSSARPVPVLAADEPADAKGGDRHTTVGLLSISVMHTWSDALPLHRTLHGPTHLQVGCRSRQSVRPKCLRPQGLRAGRQPSSARGPKRTPRRRCAPPGCVSAGPTAGAGRRATG